MANKILFPIFIRFGYSLFTPSRIQSTSQFDDVAARAASKNVAVLKLLIKKEKQYKEDIMHINDLLKNILYRYCKK